MPRFNLGSRGFGGLVSSDDDSDDLHFDQGSTIMTDSEGEDVARPIKRTTKRASPPPKSKRQRIMSHPAATERRERGDVRALRDKTNGRERHEERKLSRLGRREREESDDTVDAKDSREIGRAHV